MQDMQSLAKQLVSGLDQEGRCLERAAREELGELSANWAGKRAAEVAALREMAERFCEDLRRTERLARLGELAASVAHEIRNPLCGMMLSMEVLQTKMDADDSRNVLLENLRHEAERMEKIVANLLLFARDYQPHMIPSPLRQVVDATIESVQSHLRRKSIDVQVRSTDGACEAEVDPELIQQVFRNLLLNAIDAAPAASRLEIVIQNGVGEDEVAVAFHDEAGGI
ncbi:MAG: histidine kinase dimerization/phospho-acceptor domain-containing protein, partial [Candidatus Brocadiia bacterium]|nr:histidine kinase dimerization/phospho-acceptor domain-containing protein [Candidatus Brocadiia bacterium]